MRKLSKGIEPIIAVVILVAVTLVIAIAVVGWIMGWWGAILGGGVEDLRILTATLKSNGQVNVTIYNAGTATAEIFKIEVAGVDMKDANCKNNKKTVGPGETVSCDANIPGNYIVGARYTIIVHTKAGNKFSTVAVATA